MSFNIINSKIIDLKEIISLSEDNLLEEIETEINGIETEINSLEISLMLSNEYDNLNCYLEIHSGAGGTESCDWANMLYRMYTRYFDKNDYQYEIIEEQKGDEAGIKSITLLVKKAFAYGYLKGEKGVHRLIRISPFDSNKRRHTSFASIMVVPEFKDTSNILINDSDLKIDVFHSSGAGGQSVNTSDSAVRITHLPTKTVVACQTERSQLKNKERAMEMLKNKLLQLEEEKKEKELESVKGNNKNIEFGSQIRSYVLEPYTLVKDHRTNYETNQAEKVLDGDIEDFLISDLKEL